MSSIALCSNIVTSFSRDGEKTRTTWLHVMSARLVYGIVIAKQRDSGWRELVGVDEHNILRLCYDDSPSGYI